MVGIYETASKTYRFLEDLALSLPLILKINNSIHHTDTDNNQSTTGHCGVDTGTIRRSVLASKHQTPRNSSNTSETNQAGAGERSLPLTHDVVGLECEDGRDVGVDTHRGKEDAKIADFVVMVEAHQRKADQRNYRVKEHAWTPEMVLVADPGFGVHK
jgi:hypothetical protein